MVSHRRKQEGGEPSPEAAADQSGGGVAVAEQPMNVADANEP